MGLVNFSLGDAGSVFKDIRDAITGWQYNYIRQGA